jgi:hypothetical protein
MSVAASMADPKVANAEAIARPVKLVHSVLSTSRHEEQPVRYRLVFAASTTVADRNIGFLTYDDEHRRVAFINFPGLPNQPKATAPVGHVLAGRGVFAERFKLTRECIRGFATG